MLMFVSYSQTTRSKLKEENQLIMLWIGSDFITIADLPTHTQVHEELEAA
jgi:hypothetical protein